MTNQYDNGGQDNINPNVHVDHHNLGTIKDSEADSTFRIYLATDGGVYYTKSGKKILEQEMMNLRELVLCLMIMASCWWI